MNDKHHVKKTRVPHPEKAKSDADHMAAVKHMLEQGEANHYKFSNISVSRSDHGDASNRTHKRNFVAHFTVEDTDPSAPAADHPMAK